MSYQVLKVLMLHGHQQSADIFQPKTSHIQGAFHRFASDRAIAFDFHYMSGILPAYPDREEENDQWVWGYGHPHDGEIKKIERSIQHILDTLARDGPFAGIVGFSSGAAMAAIIASLLEKTENISKIGWKSHPRLDFIICLSGFRLGPKYDSYYQPAISTPVLVAIGSDDPVISPAQTRSLADQCRYAKLFEFPGHHYVPQRKEFPAFCEILEEFLENVLDPPQTEAAEPLAGADAEQALKESTPAKVVSKRQGSLFCRRRGSIVLASNRQAISRRGRTR